jgi:hypothetical protein
MVSGLDVMAFEILKRLIQAPAPLLIAFEIGSVEHALGRCLCLRFGHSGKADRGAHLSKCL